MHAQAGWAGARAGKREGECGGMMVHCWVGHHGHQHRNDLTVLVPVPVVCGLQYYAGTIEHGGFYWQEHQLLQRLLLET
jgi:hypothetical protein